MRGTVRNGYPLSIGIPGANGGRGPTRRITLGICYIFNRYSYREKYPTLRIPVIQRWGHPMSLAMHGGGDARRGERKKDDVPDRFLPFRPLPTGFNGFTCLADRPDLLFYQLSILGLLMVSPPSN